MNNAIPEPDALRPCARSMRIALVLVAKAAVSGRVKTRLVSPAISAQQAADVHTAFTIFLRSLVEKLAEAGAVFSGKSAGGAAPSVRTVNSGQGGDFLVQPILFIDPLGQPPESFAWPGWRTMIQPRGDLGARMSFCAKACFAETAEAIIFIGVDSVHLTLAHLEWMSQSLLKAKAAMLPAQDGGYVALGLWPEALCLLDQISWGSAAVARQTMDRATQAGIMLSVGDQLPDVDTPADLRLVMAAMASRQDSAARAVYTCLRSIMPAKETGDTVHDKPRNDRGSRGNKEF